jgi:carbon monoxide dehydrogenase subunit G
MIVVERTLSVTAAPGAVLGYLTDFASHQDWDPGTERTTRTDAGPLAPGASWHQVRRVFGVTAELTYTLLEATADRLVFHGRNEGATCVDTILVRPAGDGAEVTYRVELEMHGLAKLATPVLKVEFEKLGAEGADRLAAALDALAAPRTTEITFDAPPRTATPPPRGQEAQA